jgi:crotonobetainyl-CoA:carnitine CoA-transferase CaiB-like acyl-CoA transferase
MKAKNTSESLLRPYRVLDLTDEKGALCGKLLADLGADVIAVEPPGGSPARRVGPFFKDDPDPEKSLFWFAYNTGKRSVVLDIEKPGDREVFLNLAATADILVESFAPGHMDSIGFGYETLAALNSGLILVSISAFGQTGPYRNFKGSDIVAWAVGGQMYPWGDADRPPVRISHHSQAHLHAGAQAAAGALAALHHREKTGKGQQVDVSIQESVAHITAALTAIWDMMGVNLPRGKGMRPNSPIRVTTVWPCKDGYVIWIYWGGLSVPWNLPLVEWMIDEGEADEFISQFDWAALDYDTVDQETIDRIESPTAKFFLSRTKAELWEGALKYRAQLYPIASAPDLLHSIQLAHRGFWVDLPHPELDTVITYPGAFGKFSRFSPKVSRRAPLIGEHQAEVLAELVQKPVRFAHKSGIEIPVSDRPVNPLEGLKVVDFGWNITGPLTAKILADCGAMVIEVESGKRLDPLRTMGPFKNAEPGLNRSGNFNQWNTHKMGIALDLSHPRGIETARRLILWADVVIENFSSGTMKRMGLGYDAFKELRPDLIMLSSTMQGQEGPYAKHPGTGHQLTGLAGFNHIAGWPDRDPPYISSYTDFPAPLCNVTAILAALDFRRRNGKGLYLDMSQLENGIHFLAPVLLDYAVNNRVAVRMGNRHPRAAPHGAFRCNGEDRWCAIAVFSQEEWNAFCEAINRPGWTRDEKFSTLESRKANEEELEMHVETWTRNRSPREVMETLQNAGVPAGVIQTPEDMMEHDPQLAARGFYWRLEHPEVGTYRAPRPAFLLSGAPFAPTRAPLMGEHTAHVLSEILGLSYDEIEDLAMAGVLQ